MGRWVTSKGRRIYIPDEGEENPYAKARAAFNEASEIEKRAYNARMKNPDDEIARLTHENVKKRLQEAGEELTKQAQIAENKKQADERNGRTKYYAVYQPTEMSGKRMHTRLERVSARSEHEAVRKYKKSYPKAKDEDISLHRVEKDGKRYQNADGTWDDGHQYISKKKKQVDKKKKKG